MKVIINDKQIEMSVLQGAVGFRATEISLDHNDLKVIAGMSDEQLAARVK